MPQVMEREIPEPEALRGEDARAEIEGEDKGADAQQPGKVEPSAVEADEGLHACRISV